MDDPDFVDARLHVAVRPQLEYLLPEAARAVRDCVLGDGDASAAERAVEALLDAVRSSDVRGARRVTADVPNHPSDPSDPADPADAADAPWDASPELHRASALVCSHAADYLATLADDWGTLLTRMVSAVQEEERAARATLSRARYAADRSVVARLSLQLDAFLAECRERVPASSQRPEELVQASSRLKEAFAASYGRVPTRTLVRLKHAFEEALRKAQRPVAKRFAAHVRALLPMLTPASS